jgi:hypothetical protein
MPFNEPKRCTCSDKAVKHAVPNSGQNSNPPPPAPYTAKEAAEFVRQGACMVAWPPDELWVDPFKEGEGKGRREK